MNFLGIVAVRKCQNVQNVDSPKDTCFMHWMACSPDIDPIENSENILERKVYMGEQQFNRRMNFGMLY